MPSISNPDFLHFYHYSAIRTPAFLSSIVRLRKTDGVLTLRNLAEAANPRIFSDSAGENDQLWLNNEKYPARDLIRLIFILIIVKLLGIPKGALMEQPITSLETGTTAVILRLEGGHWFQNKMRVIGIREQKTIRLVAKHPFNGPVVVEVDGREMTIGRRMAGHIITMVPE